MIDPKYNKLRDIKFTLEETNSNLRTIKYYLGLISICLGILCGSLLARAEECPKPVQTIEKGQQANCSGFLFSDDAEKEAAKFRDDVEYYEKLVPVLETKVNKEVERNKILEKRLDLYIRQSEILAEDKIKSENRIFWERVGMFLLGAGLMYGAYDVAR